MLHNVGNIDRIIRIVLSLVLGVLYFLDLFEGRWNNAFIAGAVLMFVTGMRSCCPIYAILGFGTCGINIEDKNEPRIKTKKLDL
jgi:hypothetical protein